MCPRPLRTGAGRRCPGTGRAEEPQGLPKDWTRAQVVAVMQNFNAALGVGCDHCHVQNQGTPPDFASDDKPEKEAARAMMGITREVNASLSTELGRACRRADTHRLHHVPSRRAGTEAARGDLVGNLRREGLSSRRGAIQRAQDEVLRCPGLRLQRCGMIATAQPLVPARADEAIQFLRLNLDLFPRSARTYVASAGAQTAKQDTAGAIASLEKALEIEPNNAAARRTLDQLRR